MSDTKVSVSEGDPEDTKQKFFDNLIWLSTKDAAIYLRKFRVDGRPSEGAIRQLIWRGVLKARKWRRRLYLKRSDLDRILQTSPLTSGGYGW